MLNSPMVHNDPNGDNPLLIGAGIGFLMNGINNVSNGQNFFQGGFQAAVIGGIQGGISAGIGSAFGMTGSFLNEAGRAGAHGLSGGLFSSLGGGNFGSGFLSGAISSGIGSGINAVGGGATAQIFGGGISGGLGSVIGGGNFYDGFGTGLSTSILNHVAHNTFGGDPPTKEEIKYYLATEFDAGRLTRQEYVNAIILVEEGSWGLIKQVLSNNKEEITMAALPFGRAGKLFKGLNPMKYRWFRKNIFNKFPSEKGYGVSFFNFIRYHNNHIKFHGPHRQIDINLFGTWKSFRIPRKP